MKFIAIIPARFASTRFPGKPLAILGGKPVIQRVYEQVVGVLDDAVVATDDERIYAAVEAFGGKVVMTSPDHKSGTDRCYEAFCKVGGDYDVVVNVQGDEPFIHPSQLEAIKRCFDNPATDIATLVKPFPLSARCGEGGVAPLPHILQTYRYVRFPCQCIARGDGSAAICTRKGGVARAVALVGEWI